MFGGIAFGWPEFAGMWVDTGAAPVVPKHVALLANDAGDAVLQANDAGDIGDLLGSIDTTDYEAGD